MRYKDAQCKCGANLKGIEPVNPVLNPEPPLEPGVRSIADCPNPECSETLVIVEGELGPIPEPEPTEPATEPVAEAEPKAEAEPVAEAEPEPTTEPEPEPKPEE